VAVPRCQRQVILPCQSRNPQIVVWNGLANLGEFRLQLSVVLGSALVGQQNDSSLQEIADTFKLCLSPLASPCTVVEFSEYNPRQVQRGGLGEPRGQGLLAAKVRNDDIRVYQDTTSRVH
jgi:hypothetical protein